VQPAVESSGTAEGFTLKTIMKTVIETIPHKNQRYETCGDYFTDPDGTTQVRVSDMGNEDYAFLVSIHEQIEEYLTRKRGIDETDIKVFDELFEKNRQPGNDDEPGDQLEAPYHKEHVFAECLERLLARELGVDWAEYGKAVMAL